MLYKNKPFIWTKFGVYMNKNVNIRTDDKLFLNHDDKDLTDGIKRKLNSLFPNPSKFEK